jgi:hypothetical protein
LLLIGCFSGGGIVSGKRRFDGINFEPHKLPDCPQLHLPWGSAGERSETALLNWC